MSNGNPHRLRPIRKRGRPSNPARDKALLAGAIRFNGSPCKWGHAGERYVSTGACVVCMGATETRDEFAAIWE